MKKSLPNILFIDAMNTIFHPLLGRWALYQLLLERYTGIKADIAQIQAVYNLKRQEKETREPFLTEKLPKGYYRRYWGDINAQIIRHFDLNFQKAEACGQAITIQVLGNPEFYTVPPEVVAFLEKAVFKGFKIFIVSNHELDMLTQMVRAFNIMPLINGGIIASDEVGFKKPDKRFFVCALELAAADPEAVIFLGNNPKNDMAGAASVGINHRFLYDPREENKNTQAKADFIKLRKLDDLFKQFS